MTEAKEVDVVKESIDVINTITQRQWQLAHDFDNRILSIYDHRRYLRNLINALVDLREGVSRSQPEAFLNPLKVISLRAAKEAREKALKSFDLLLNAAKTDLEQEQQLIQQMNSALVNRRQLFMSFLRYKDKQRTAAMEVVLNSIAENIRHQPDSEKLPDQLKIIIKWMESTFDAERRIVEAEKHLLEEIEVFLSNLQPTITQMDSWIFNLGDNVQKLEKVLREERYRVIIPLQKILEEKRHADTRAFAASKQAKITKEIIARDVATFIDPSDMQRYYAQLMPFRGLIDDDAMAFLQRAMLTSAREGESRFFNLERFKKMALTDEKTGSYSNAYGTREGNRILSESQRNNQPFSLIIIDGDKFKDVNDIYGHLTGDAILRIIVQCAVKNVRNEDSVYRYGGEEFIVLLPGINKDGAVLVAKRILDSVPKESTSLFTKLNPQTLQDLEKRAKGNAQVLAELKARMKTRLTVSIGIATYPEDLLSIPGSTLTIPTLIQIADQYLYDAKEDGRNRASSSKGQVLGPP